MSIAKYANPPVIEIPDRKWPGHQLTISPTWVSVDLRDGNQSLPNPLSPAQKMEYFKLLCGIGFKEIEIAFPSASQDDFDFTRRLIMEKHIPDDVFIMGLTQCREHLIRRTFEAFAGVKHAIVHSYIATSDLHMKRVFGLTRQQTIDSAVNATRLIRELCEAQPQSDLRHQFSPEEFTDTDIDFAVEICEAVYDTWGKATPERPLILNLPATVERRPPNHYADMIELFCRKFSHMDSVIISLHAHNDQGMAVASTELALLAGATRVEGTLFGHGERTGNIDLVTMINNLASRGIDTGMDFTGLPDIAKTIARLTGLDIYYRQPYSGELVFTAFSGSHQDAIRKGMKVRDENPEDFGMGWKVPYLHIDPADVGRKYENLIRINSQSGKGGAAWVLEQEFGFSLPKDMLPELGHCVQSFTDHKGREINSAELYDLFRDEFIAPIGRYELLGYWPVPDEANPSLVHGRVSVKMGERMVEAQADGNGPLAAFVLAMREITGLDFSVGNYHEQAMGTGENARAAAYVPLQVSGVGRVYGVGVDTNITQAAVRAILSGLNRISRK